ncbi:MAG: hypothetical protein KA004_17860 [Verrucomicrobiales bacterium]|nr:hypothetical protein [Verrucomicrobiales bacterium]
MSSRVSAGNLEQAVRDLHVEWQNTKASWTDAKSLEFERDYLDKLPQLVHQARGIIEEIDALLRKMRTDCE